MGGLGLSRPNLAAIRLPSNVFCSTMGNLTAQCKPAVYEYSSVVCHGVDNEPIIVLPCYSDIESCGEGVTAGPKRAILLNSSFMAAARAGDARALELAIAKGADLETRKPMIMARLD